MSAAESRRLVVLALLANLGIAITKFAAAAVAKSSAMLAEAFHSLADTGNQLFLLRGEAAAREAPDVQHPFGKGKELYFWAFMVAVVLFVGGSVLSIVGGIDKIRHAEAHEQVGLWLSLGVLAIAAFFEMFVAFRPALQEFNRLRAGRFIPTTIREGKDPALLIVLFEDSAAVVGLAIAAVGIIVAHVTGDVRWDGLASILIGVLLAGVAWVIAHEMKALLIGESATRETRAAIRAATLSVPEVDHIEDLLTMQLSPRDVLVNMEVDFDEGLEEEEVEEAIRTVEQAIREVVPEATRIFIEPVGR